MLFWIILLKKIKVKHVLTMVKKINRIVKKLKIVDLCVFQENVII